MNAESRGTLKRMNHVVRNCWNSNLVTLQNDVLHRMIFISSNWAAKKELRVGRKQE